MSEVELHLIKQRMAAGRLAKAARGELAVPLPAGYARRPSGEAILDPDEQVQAVVRLVFGLFEELGTVHAVLGFLVGHQVQIGMRAWAGPAKGEVVWRRPHQTGIQNMLRNPAYAGIYAYGQTRFDPGRKIPGHPHTGRRRTAAADWLVKIPGVLPAYITVEQYERNLARMAENRARAEAAGAPRQGPALLAGLLACGICGRRMGVTYETNRAGLIHRYVCVREHQSYGTQRCQQMAGAFLDDWVTGQVLAALAPAALELSLHAAGQAEQRRAEVDRIWRQRLERAGQACDRARRQYQLAEPENRLVTRQLEKDWKAALAARQELAEDYQRFTCSRPARLTAAERAAIERLAGDIPALWQAPATTHADRKKLLRCVIERVEVAAPGAGEKVRAVIVWAGGSTTTADLTRPVARISQLSYYPQLVARLRELAGQGLTAHAIADQLAAENIRPPRQHERFHDGQILQLLGRHSLRPAPASRRRARRSLGPGQWWLAGLARELEMPVATLTGWLNRGWAAGRQEPSPPHRWIVTADPAEVERLRALHRLPAGYHNRHRWADDDTLTSSSQDKEPDTHAR